MLLSLGTAPQADAQTFTVIYTFHGTDGLYPLGNLILDGSGKLIGTTYGGGSAYGTDPLRGYFSGYGTVFSIDASDTETVLHSFTGGWDYMHGVPLSGGDGIFPKPGVVRDAAGNLYGTTYEGGGYCTDPRGGIIGCGTVFKIDPAGNETVLHAFNLTSDGAYPSSLAIDASGNLYGATSMGGGSWPPTCNVSMYGCGTVFRIDTNGDETVLHTFSGWETPNAGVILDAAGNLYGTTSSGGGTSCCGNVFRIDAAGNYSVLHSFTSADGGPPQGLVRDATGNLFGTIGSGGSAGYGSIFKIDAAGNYSVLHNFSGSDGKNPSGPLVLDAWGNLYGSAQYGGGDASCGALGCGTVFRIDAAGNFSVLHSFNGSDGATPNGGLALDAAGNLSGTTYAGPGTVFKIDLSVAPFSLFSAKLDLAAGGFQLQAFFTQAAGAAAINPVTQGMTLALGTYTVTIPPGAFLQTKKGWFVYDGMIQGVALDIRISQTGASSYELQAEGSGVDLSSLTNPVALTLAIGSNNGRTEVNQ